MASLWEKKLFKFVWFFSLSFPRAVIRDDEEFFVSGACFCWQTTRYGSLFVVIDGEEERMKEIKGLARARSCAPCVVRCTGSSSN